MIRWIIFTEQRAGRPRRCRAEGVTDEVLMVHFYQTPGRQTQRPSPPWAVTARKMIRWIIFTEQRTGSPQKPSPLGKVSRRRRDG